MPIRGCFNTHIAKKPVEQLPLEPILIKLHVLGLYREDSPNSMFAIRNAEPYKSEGFAGARLRNGSVLTILNSRR